MTISNITIVRKRVIFMKRFGNNLQILRTDHDMTQEELGRILNVSQSTIAYYESGKKQPSLETLAVIADFFHVSADYLLDRKEYSVHATLTSQLKISREDLNLLKRFSNLSDTDRKELESYIRFKEQQRKHSH